MSSRQALSGKVLTMVVVLIATMTLAGCGATPFGETITVSGQQYAPLTAQNMPSEIVAAAKKAHSVHVVGASDDIKLDLTIVRGEGAKGTMTKDGETIELIAVNGKYYVELTASLAEHEHIGNVPRGMIGKWAAVPNLSDDSDLREFSDYNSFVNGVLGGAKEDTFTAHGTRRVGGITCRYFVDNSDQSQVDIAAAGAPLLIRLAAHDGGRSIAFQWNVKAQIAAPQPSQLVQVPGGLGEIDA